LFVCLCIPCASLNNAPACLPHKQQASKQQPSSNQASNPQAMVSKSSLPTRRGGKPGGKQQQQRGPPVAQGEAALSQAPKASLYHQLTATPASVKAARSLGGKGSSTKMAQRIAKREGKEAQGAAFVDPKTTRKILAIVREQQEELEREEGTAAAAVLGAAAAPMTSSSTSLPGPADSEDEDMASAADDDEEQEEEEEEEEELYSDFEEEYDAEGQQDQQAARLLVNEREQAILDTFMAPEPRKQLQLSDLVMSKIQSANEHAAAAATSSSSSGPTGQAPVGVMNPKIIEVYTK
jgi:hypothetical protein